MNSKNYPKSGASLIILYTDDHKLLLQDRTGISKWGEDWACFGGALEPGETCDDTLVRELKEELNYDIKEFNLYVSLKGEETEYNWYYKNITKDLDKLTVLEGAGMKLFSFDEIKELNIVQRQKDRILEFEKFIKKMKPDIVSMLFYTNDNKILLQERTGFEGDEEQWGFFGGRVEEGESHEEAIVREMKEELDYDLPTTPIWITKKTSERNIIYFKYNITHDKNNLTLLDGKDMKFVSFSEAKNIPLYPGSEEMIDKLEEFIQEF